MGHECREPTPHQCHRHVRHTHTPQHVHLGHMPSKHTFAPLLLQPRSGAARLAMWAAHLPANNGARGNEQVELLVTLAQDRTGVGSLCPRPSG